MKSKAILHFISILMFVAVNLPLWCGGQAAKEANPSENKPGQNPGIADIRISFKLDSRLSGPSYGGEHWVSPPTLTAASGQEVVEAKVIGVGVMGEPVRITPEWILSDPEMVTVSPSQGDQVQIAVHRDGESTVQVTAAGVSKELAVKAEYKGKIIQVQITQMATAKPGNLATRPDAAAPKTEGQPKFKSQKEKLSYALGMNLANAFQKQSVEVDEDTLFRGFKDARAGNGALLTAQEVRATIVEMQAELQRKQQQVSLGGTNKNLAEKNKKEGEAFLAENRKKEGIITLPSGPQYKVLKAGDGRKPAPSDAVTCNYRGILIDGTEFDSSYKRGRTATFAVNKVIKGWSEALQLMPVGSRWQLFVPADLAYGQWGTRRGGIGPNATLIYEVDLLSITNAISGTEARTEKEQGSTTRQEPVSRSAAPAAPLAVKP